MCRVRMVLGNDTHTVEEPGTGSSVKGGHLATINRR
jgi:hypothetical protein